MGEGKTTYTFSVSVNAFSVEFPLACYQQAGRVWYVSGALRRTYTLFYPTPSNMQKYIKPSCEKFLTLEHSIWRHDTLLNGIQHNGIQCVCVIYAECGK
jgi:hypothetical protein